MEQDGVGWRVVRRVLRIQLPEPREFMPDQPLDTLRLSELGSILWEAGLHAGETVNSEKAWEAIRRVQDELLRRDYTRTDLPDRLCMAILVGYRRKGGQA